MARKRKAYTVGKALEIMARYTTTSDTLTVTVKRVDARPCGTVYTLAVAGQQRALVMFERELKRREIKPAPLPLALAG